MKTYYFLFGEDAVTAYFTMHDGTGDNPSYQEVADAIKATSYEVKELNEGQVHPVNLMYADDGWQGYTLIPQELFYLLEQA